MTTETINAAHRCDRCGAQSYVRVAMPDGLKLDFCGHHYQKAKTGLSKSGAVMVVNQLDKLTAGK